MSIMGILEQTDFLDGITESSAGLITLRNKNGLVAQFTNYGARWVSMWIPDKKGELGDILLGFDKLFGYINADEQYHGAIVGRVCGRISNARFSLGDKEYVLSSNDVYGYPEKNHLHGGNYAFHNRFWTVEKEGSDSVTFSLFSPDGEESYPGNLNVNITYSITDDNILRMECVATSDRVTPVNITNHAFFNLRTDTRNKNILSQLLMINADEIIICNQELIPTGEIALVSNTYLDFSTPRTMDDSLRSADNKVKQDNGFSVAYVLKSGEGAMRQAALLFDEESGRIMEVFTNQPSIQLYNGYFMDGKDVGKNKIPYYANAGFALESQGYPDAPNNPGFPTIFIGNEKEYVHQTEYRFALKEDS